MNHEETRAETRSVAALIDAGGVVDHAALFVALWRVIGELRGLIDGRFELRAEPAVQPLARYANADDSCRGELGSFCGEGVDRLVQAWLGAPERGFMNLHLNVWLGPETRVPHLAVVFATVPELFVYLDYPARVDVASEPDYVDRYYAEAYARVVELSADAVFVPYVSRSAYMRAVQSPAAVCGFVRGAGAVERVRELAREHVRRWLGWVDAASAAEAVPEGRRGELAARDLWLRRSIVERDPANGVAERMFGVELTRRLVAALWGGVDTGSM